MPPKVKETKNLFRILMLHGNRQNAEVFRDKTGGVRKKIKSLAEFVYCDAPNLAPKSAQPVAEEPEESPEDQADSSMDKTETVEQIPRCWFLRKSDQTKEDNKQFSEKFEATLDYIDDIFRTKGPFDAVWGFSQGATFTSILSRISYEQNDSPKRRNIRFKFAIIASTSISPNEPELFCYFDKDKKIDMPSLHMMGKTDRIINYEKSLELSEHFVDPEIYLHESGHFIPRNREAKVVFTNFLNKMYEKFKK
jgi:predicted esterase